jgi:mannose-1-phosphate guanylyltransferase
MLTSVQLVDDGIAVINVSGSFTKASVVHNFAKIVDNLCAEGRRGIILDLSKVRRMNMAGLAALVELAARRSNWDLGFCALPERQAKFLQKSGLDRGLLIFPSVDAACKTATFQTHTLAGTRTVLLCAATDMNVAPLTDIFPKPMLDVVGKPILHRIIDRLNVFGLNDILLNPGHLGDQIVDYFRNVQIPGNRMTYVNEGIWNDTTWKAKPIGCASTLKRMHDNNAAFDSDFVVLGGAALNDVDLAKMMREHRLSGADATIATCAVPDSEIHKYATVKMGQDQAITRLFEQTDNEISKKRRVNTGIYIFKPAVLSLLSHDQGLDIVRDLLPAILAAGGKIHSHNHQSSWIDIGCGKDYAQAIVNTLQGDLPFIKPMGDEIRPRVWAMPGAKVSPNAQILGPCHIGSGAQIKANACIKGVCSIGSGAVVEGGTVLENCMVMPNTHVQSGAWATSMILEGRWAVDHTRANGRMQNCNPIDYVTALQDGTFVKDTPVSILKRA